VEKEKDEYFAPILDKLNKDRDLEKELKEAL